MTQDEIIRMAREAGLAEWHESIQQHGFKFADVNNLERFAALVAAHERERVMNEPLTKAMWDRFESEIRADEREACAKVCDKYATGGDGSRYDMGRLDASTSCAAAIRARKF